MIIKMIKIHANKKRISYPKALPPTWVKGDGWFLTPHGKKIAQYEERHNTIIITF